MTPQLKPTTAELKTKRPELNPKTPELKGAKTTEVKQSRSPELRI